MGVKLVFLRNSLIKFMYTPGSFRRCVWTVDCGHPCIVSVVDEAVTIQKSPYFYEQMRNALV